MIHNGIITENQLDEWVRGNAREAQGVIVELVYRLVAASSSKPKERRFPLGDSIGQPGPDGVLDTDFGFDPFVPEGRSFWEIGTGSKAGDKATSDYNGLVEATPETVRLQSTFVFVTPLSGRRDWPHTWKEDAQLSWLKDRRNRNDWSDVRIIDGSILIDWLQHFPAVEKWLAAAIGLSSRQMQTPEQRWAELRTIGEPPPLTPHLFLVNRDTACEKIMEVFSGTTVQLKLDTHFPDQVVDFVSAYIANMREDERIDTVGRCLIISGTDAWNDIIALSEQHILIADNIDETDASATRLLEKARRAGHAVIFGGMPGGIPHPTRVSLPSPNIDQVKEALEKANYNEERARILAQQSGGNLSSLLRRLQNLSLMPEWSQGTDASELAVAELLGGWNEKSEADKSVVEVLSKKAYGEWIGKMREVALYPGTPLIQRDGTWKVVARYEGWYALGPRLFDEHLDLIKEIAVSVLRERDPQFDLSPNERYAASVHGKVLNHSHQLRNGLADSLALLGSHPKALASCSFEKAEITAVLAVREILSDADWVLWASLNDLLPLLAEAAPGEFLDAVENALSSDSCPFDMIFEQEGAGIMGRNYMTGLLWGLETLAWDADYLTRVVVILGELAARDPGGNWANRPANSLSTILLPWLPQTCAPIQKRIAAVLTLFNELPDISWKLILDLLPRSHQVTSGSRKPAWREIIPDECSKGTTQREYWEQIATYAELAIHSAKQDLLKLAELIDRLDDFPPPARDQLLAHLRSNTVISMSQADRLRLWTKLIDLVSNHRKFAEAEWALKPDVVDEIASVAENLAKDPIYRHQRLFSERDFNLYDEERSYEEQQKILENLRQKAVGEVFEAGSIEAVLEFAESVERPWFVGFAFGMIAPNNVEEMILPALLESENNSLVQFAGGFVWGKFRDKGWQWVDYIDTSRWEQSQKGQFLAYLPFTPETWKRVTQLLEEDESLYWSKTNANPYDTEEGLEQAIDHLVNHNRPYEAIRCLKRLLNDKQQLNSQQAVHVLQAVLHSLESAHMMDINAIIDVIKAVQNDPNVNSDNLIQIEWAFLPLLDRQHDASPKLLEQQLADDPAFFSELIRIVFKSKNEEGPAEEATEQQKNIAKNAYKLLREWSIPPGSHKDGTFNGDAFSAWLEYAKKACLESGHLEIGLSMVGHVLIHAPPDPDGLWIHHSIASALNAKDANDIRDGFQIELYNSRGVHFVDPEGKEERKLAEKYRIQAGEVEDWGYHRLASSLRELAASYEHDAEQLASRNFFDD